MDDLISRQAAIDEAGEWIEAVYCDHEEQRERDAIKHVINGIKGLPSVQPEQKWIPVSKELPKTNVLVWVTDLHQHVSACQLYTDISDWYSESDEWMYKHDSIIAWKPYIVPEPYKEGEPG